MSKAVVIALAVAAGLAAVFGYHQRAETGGASSPITVYCAANFRKPMDEIAAAYTRETGVPVQLQYGGTASLLSMLRVGGKGDLFLAADELGIADAQKYDLIREVLPMARQKLVIAVAHGNPRGIKSAKDLLREDVRLGLVNAESAAAGRETQRALGDEYDTYARHARVLKPTPPDLASDLTLGTIDAAIVWDSTAVQLKGVEAVHPPELAQSHQNAALAVLASTDQPTAALKFARYVSAPEKGAATLAQHGFAAAAGDAWAPKPKLVIYSGSVNRLAVEKSLQEFANREGVDLTTVFNGCGILCASMQAMEKGGSEQLPDVYYACDVCFVHPVAHIYPEAVLLTETDIVIAVPRGNPKKIATLADLAQQGLKLGICNTEQSTLGFMTEGILRDSGVKKALAANVRAQTPTADMLINQLRTGSLDAVIVYDVNVAPVQTHVEAIPIKHAGARAVQPFAVSVLTPYPQMGKRLLAHIRGNRADFEQAGFRWRGDEAPVATKDLDIPPWLRGAVAN